MGRILVDRFEVEGQLWTLNSEMSMGSNGKAAKAMIEYTDLDSKKVVWAAATNVGVETKNCPSRRALI